MLESDKNRFINFQWKLDEMYLRKAREAYIRSRAKWLEEGEKNSAYLCGLEKKRQERNAVNVLLINDVECTDPKPLSNEVHRFYKLCLFTHSLFYTAPCNCVRLELHF